jgi:hypothetical protein
VITWDGVTSRKNFFVVSENLKIPVNAASFHGFGVGDGANWGMYFTITEFDGRTKRPNPNPIAPNTIHIAIAVRGLIRKRKSTPSFCMTFFHQSFRYVIGFVISKLRRGGAEFLDEDVVFEEVLLINRPFESLFCLELLNLKMDILHQFSI